MNGFYQCVATHQEIHVQRTFHVDVLPHDFRKSSVRSLFPGMLITGE